MRAANPNLSARDFGNAVHLGIKDRIDKMHDRNFVAEMLVSPTGNNPRATEKGNLRLDLYENVVKNRTVCVYDFKTGELDLPFARASRFADYILKIFPETLRVIIGQVRPGT